LPSGELTKTVLLLHKQKIELEHAIIIKRKAEEEAATEKKANLVEATTKTLRVVKNRENSKLLEEVTIENKVSSSRSNKEHGRRRIRSGSDQRSYNRSSEHNHESNIHKVCSRSRSDSRSQNSKNKFIILYICI
jgi:hypothetical protein